MVWWLFWQGRCDKRYGLSSQKTHMSPRETLYVISRGSWAAIPRPSGIPREELGVCGECGVPWLW